jgi:hypothetical protein
MACGLKRLTEEERGGAWTLRQKKPHKERAVSLSETVRIIYVIRTLPDEKWYN